MRGLDQEPGSLGVVGEERRSAKLWSLERPWGGGGAGSLQGRLGTCSPPRLPLHLAAEAEGRRRKAATGRTVTGTPCPQIPDVDREGSRLIPAAYLASSVSVALDVHRRPMG